MKTPIDLFLDLLKQEAYTYFDEYIRKLPKTSNGEFDESTGAMHNNDADAFKHAYSSGIITQKYSEEVAKIMGLLVELLGRNPEGEKNMDLWNNSIGRKYAKKVKSRQELADKLKAALDKGELIVTPSDSRKYEGKTSFNFDPAKPVIVLEEKETGRNETFLDVLTGEIMDREIFVNQIRIGKYPGYTAANINEMNTPMSKPDGIKDNNLG